MLRKCGNSIHYDNYPKLLKCNFITASYKISDFWVFLLLRVIKNERGLHLEHLIPFVPFYYQEKGYQLRSKEKTRSSAYVIAIF